MTEDEGGAFLPGPRIHIEGRSDGPLAGLTFAAKDLFDVAGHPTGGGNPDWPRGRTSPARHAWAVQRLLDAGATLVGKTVTDEVSLGILGENAFDGTPANPAAPGRVPGGSSSGSASAVAAGLADTAIGTDTGGSVRVPASFCGLYGIRPTHGRLPLDGMAPQAPSSDTTGWFARDARTFARVAEVMLGETTPPFALPRLVVAVDAFGFADAAVAAALAPALDRLKAMAGAVEEDLLAPQGLSVWGRAQRTIQPHEAWTTFAEWVDATNPRMAFTVARGLLAGAAAAPEDLKWAGLMRAEARSRLAWLTRTGGVVALPTTPFPAPLKGLSIREMDPVRERILCLCAHGGLAGFPQISIPAGAASGLPVGLSLVAARGGDAALAAIALRLAEETTA
ncbi:MAG: amidase [Alphaproteobacteria bacterium]